MSTCRLFQHSLGDLWINPLNYVSILDTRTAFVSQQVHNANVVEGRCFDKVTKHSNESHIQIMLVMLDKLAENRRNEPNLEF